MVSFCGKINGLYSGSGSILGRDLFSICVCSGRLRMCFGPPALSDLFLRACNVVIAAFPKLHFPKFTVKTCCSVLESFPLETAAQFGTGRAAVLSSIVR